MKKKINTRFEINNYIASNDIYRKFKFQFDALLNPNERIASSSQLEQIYVHDEDFEKEINDFKSSLTSQLQFVIGYTGIGKTTSLRYCFGLRINNAPIYRETQKELILPTFFDAHNDSGHTQEDALNSLAKRMESVCSLMEKEFEDIGQLFSGEHEAADKEAFYSFIESYKPEIMQDIDELVFHRSPSEKVIHGLETAHRTDKFAFFAMKLKYYISLKRDKIERFTLIIDDIESLNWDYQKKVIDSYLSLYECLFNTVEDTKKPCIINMLISVRPHTYRLLHYYRQIDAYPLEPEILKKGISLRKLFKKRFDYFTIYSQRPIGNIDTWKQCYHELMLLTERFDNKFSKMIMELTYYNIRESLRIYTTILGNRLWVQNNKIIAEHFTIISDEYKFNNISVLRALACQENEVYSEKINSHIPNILINDKEYDYTLYILLLIRYFEQHQSDIEFYGMKSINISKIYEDFKQIGVHHKTENWLFECIALLFEKKILRKSLKDADNTETLDKRDSLSTESRLYLSPLGFAIWKLFSSDSVLLEMYREDIYLDDSYIDDKGRHFSFYASTEKPQAEIFEELLKYIKYLCLKEKNIRKKVNGR